VAKCTHNLGELGIALRADDAMLVAIPLILALVTVHHLPPAGALRCRRLLARGSHDGGVCGVERELEGV
jgi:hypothetical protein